MASRDQSRGQSVTEAQQIREAEREESRAVLSDSVVAWAKRASEVTPGASLMLAGDQPFFTQEQVVALHHLGVSGATRPDLSVFFHVCQRTQLDPFSRQIHMIKRQQWNKDIRSMEDRWTIQTGIDGYRVIRDRAARRDGVEVGYDDTLWFDADGNEFRVWLKAEPPHACRHVTFKATELGRMPFPAVVLFREVAAFKRGTTDLQAEWAHQPVNMAAKCAEAASLRKAFPNDYSGLYIDDEMARMDEGSRQDRQAATRRRAGARVVAAEVVGGTEPDVPADAAADLAGAEQDHRKHLMGQLHAVCRELGIGDDRGVRMGVLAMLGRTDPDGLPLPLVSSSDLTDEQAERAVVALAGIRDAARKAGEPAEAITGHLKTLAVAGGWEGEPDE